VTAAIHIVQQMTLLRRRGLLAAALCSIWTSAGALDKPQGPVVLTVGKAAAFDMAMLERIKQRSIRTTTPWYDGPREFTGPLLRDVLAAAGLPADARGSARFVALNDYRVDIPLEDARHYDVIIARLVDGKPMGVREKGPLFVMYPFDQHPELRTAVYFSRCIWQLRSIEPPA
jgi:hypothetical protein